MAQKRIQYLSIADISKLEKAIKNSRDSLVLKILYETGCTVNELVSLKLDDIDSAHNRINFPANITKSKSSKTAMISKGLGEDINSYTDEKDKAGIKSNFLFSSRQSQSMTTKRARQLILSYGKKAGFGKVLPQMIRYAHVLHAVKKSLPLAAIEKQTGLDKIRLVQIMDAATEEEPDQAYTSFFGGDQK